MTHLLDVQNLSVAFGSVQAVKNVSFHVDAGEVLCLVGESGSGKTVSALAVMDLLPPQATILSGAALFDGKDVLTMDAEPRRLLRGAQMSMIFQEPMTSLNPVFKVGDQVAEVLAVHGVGDAKSRYKRVIELFSKVQIPEPERRYHAYPNQLSGGQRQRVMIAMALAMNTRLLIADEPTTALDVTVQGEILSLIRSLQKESGMGVLFITHDFGVVRALADRVAVMQHGQIVEQGTVKQVMEKPKHAYTKSLLAAMPRLETGAKAVVATPPLLEVKNVSKVFQVKKGGFFSTSKPFKALDGVSVTLHKGETLGIVGESGCGKSTLARCLMRIYKPDAGEVVLNGQNTAPLKGAALRAMRRNIQMVFQDPFSSLNPRMRVGESVGEGLRAYGLMDAKARRVYVEQLLADCGLPAGSYDRYPHQFSGGQRQRVCIARALALKPDIIIADEPVSALDVSVQKQILELMDKLKKEHGLSYVFISHDLRVVSQVCDRIAVMHAGKVVEEGTTHALFTNPQHPYTRTLLAAIPGEDKVA
ncbi:MAG: dipeptide ABC transporter ATP-binding protein [Proteobacteria bacterium]|nr:dipeptide ABC transporter ATP-binding protein [Pseudomonadota bacterium]